MALCGACTVRADGAPIRSCPPSTSTAPTSGRSRRSARQIEQAIRAWHRGNEASRRLATIPGVGSLTASAIVATVANATEFKSARHFAAFLGLTPKQCSTGGRQRLGRISKQGDVYIRRLLVLGGTSLVRYARGAGGSVWAKQLLARRPHKL